jgi:ATPase
VEAVYDVALVVKVPSGMIEADLSRPVIEVRNFDTGELTHEIYTYGEQTIVMEVGTTTYEKTPVQKIAEREIIKEIKKTVPGARIEVDMKSDKRATVWMDEKYIPKLIGKKGKTIDEVERRIGISIGVEPFRANENEDTFGVDVEIAGNYVVLNFGKDNIGTPFDILVKDEYLFTATVGKKGTIKIKKDIELAVIILDALKRSIPIEARVRNE